MIKQIQSPCFDYMVSINCMTYNHSLYIKDALDGFCMQNTNFPFVAIIVDDASTDGEPKIIRDYLYKYFSMETAHQWETDDAYFIEVRHKENKNCLFAVVLLKINFYGKKDKTPLIERWLCHSKYIAFCEGDDYWVDLEKLQTQVNFLEENETYSMCYSGFKTVDQYGTEIFRANDEKTMRMSKSGDILGDLLVTNFILTCTTLFRNGMITIPSLSGFKYSHDYTMFLAASTHGLCKYFPQKMSAYRKVPTGAMATQRDWVSMAFHETRLFFYDGLLNGTISLDKQRFNSKIKRTIATYCFFENTEEFKDRYRMIIYNHKVLWKYIPELALKKNYVQTLGLIKRIFR